MAEEQKHEVDMKRTYVVGTFVDSMTGMNADEFSGPYDVIEAESKEDACGIYNKAHNCDYFYARVMAEVADGKIVELDDYARPFDVKKALADAKRTPVTDGECGYCCPDSIPEKCVRRTIGYLGGKSWHYA